MDDKGVKIFAALARVSTERQEKKGESLALQEKNIRFAVKQLGGTIPEDCYFSGQEHSSKGYEREILDRLLAEASSGKFNAVIVDDISRWGRDNKKSKEGLEILRKNDIKFYSLTTEFDLNDPEKILVLGMFGEFHEFQASQTAKKSMASRIEKANRGFPSFGHPPFGYRVIGEDEKRYAIWEVIPECRKFLYKVLEQYTSRNIGFKRLAQELSTDPIWNEIKNLTSMKQLDPSNLANLLLKRSSRTEYVIHPKNKSHSDIVIKLPEPLIPDHELTFAREKAEMNKSRLGRPYDNTYPLSGVLFCSICGNSLTGFKNGGNNRYYRHNNDTLKSDRCVKNIHAKDIEPAVLYEIALLVGNAPYLKDAFLKAKNQNLSESNKLKDRRNDIERNITNLFKQKSRFIDSIGVEASKGVRKSILEKLEEIERDVEKYQAELASLLNKLSSATNLPSDAAVDNIVKQFKLLTARRNINTLHSEKQKQLMAFMIGGKTVNERKRLKLGIYVSDEIDSESKDDFRRLEINGQIFGRVETPITNNVYIGDKYYYGEQNAVDISDFSELIEIWELSKSFVPAKSSSQLWLQHYK